VGGGAAVGASGVEVTTITSGVGVSLEHAARINIADIAKKEILVDFIF